MRLRPLLQLDSSRAFWDTNGDRPGSHVARPVRGTSTTRPRHVHRRALCVEPLLRRVGRLRRPPPPPRTARVRRPRRGCAGHAARAGARPSGVGDAHLHALPLPDVAVALARAPRRRADVADRLAAPHTVCLDLAGLRGFASRFYPSPTCTRTHTHAHTHTRTHTHAHTHARTHARTRARTHGTSGDRPSPEAPLPLPQVFGSRMWRADNYFYYAYAVGRWDPHCCPRYLRPEHYEALRSSAHRVALHHGPLASAAAIRADFTVGVMSRKCLGGVTEVSRRAATTSRWPRSSTRWTGWAR